jgi:hypothetical protein
MYSEESFDHPYTNLAKLSGRNLSGTNDGFTVDEFVTFIWNKLNSYKVRLDVGSFQPVFDFLKISELSIADIVPFGFADVFLQIAKQKINEKLSDALKIKEEAKKKDSTIAKAIVDLLWNELEEDLKAAFSKDYQIDIPYGDSTIKQGLWDSIADLNIGDFLLYVIGSLEDPAKIAVFDYMGDNIGISGTCGIFIAAFAKDSAFGSAGRNYITKKIAGYLKDLFRMFCIDVLGVPAEEFIGPVDAPEGNPVATYTDGMFSGDKLIQINQFAGYIASYSFLHSRDVIFNGNPPDVHSLERQCESIVNAKIFEYWPPIPGDGFFVYMKTKVMNIVYQLTAKFEYDLVRSRTITPEMMQDLKQHYSTKRASITLAQLREAQARAQGGSGAIPIVPIVVGGIGLLLLLKYFKK